MTERLRIGVIGGGGIAGAHVRAYHKMDDVQVVGVADIVPGKAQEFIEKHGLSDARAFTDHRELLQTDLDAVSICVPNVGHHRTTVDALAAGKHVLLEKPLSVTLGEGVDMARAARRADRILSIGFQPRYDPNMKLIREMVQSGLLGKVYYVLTGGGRRRGMPGGTFIRKDLAGVGAMADIGCYSLDMALLAIGYPKPLTVSAYTSNYFGANPLYHPEADRFEVEDFGAAFIRLEGGIVLNFQISWAMHMDSLGPSVFLGTEAGLRVTPGGTGPWGGAWDGGVGSITLCHDVMKRNTDSPIPLIRHNVDIFYEKVRDFVVAVREGLPAPIPVDQILYNQAILDGVFRSAKAGREVVLDIPDLRDMESFPR